MSRVPRYGDGGQVSEATIFVDAQATTAEQTRHETADPFGSASVLEDGGDSSRREYDRKAFVSAGANRIDAFELDAEDVQISEELGNLRFAHVGGMTKGVAGLVLGMATTMKEEETIDPSNQIVHGASA